MERHGSSPTTFENIETFKSYVFDLDQNILHTKTPIYLLIKQPDGTRKEEPVPNSEFETRLQDKEHVKFHKDVNHSLRDFMGYDKLIEDVFAAITDKAYGPSWEKFITATIEAVPTHIITARSNPREAFRAMHKKIIYEILNQGQRDELILNMKQHLHNHISNPAELIDIYLNNNLYIPCANPELVRSLKWGQKTGEEKKGLAFEKCSKQTIDTYTNYYGKEFMKHKNISIGFSDDSTKNIDAVTQKIIEKLIKKNPHISFMLYNTQEPTIIRKETIHRKSR